MLRLSLAMLGALSLLAFPKPAASDPGHAHPGHGHTTSFSAGQPGDPKKPARTVGEGEES